MPEQPLKFSANVEIWEQQPKEPALWFRRLDIYRQIGYTRNLRKVWLIEKALEEDGIKAILGNVAIAPTLMNSLVGADKVWSSETYPEVGKWKKHFDQWRWQERVEAWDVHQAKLNEIINKERIAQSREAIYSRFNIMLERVDGMLEQPLTTQMITDGPNGQSIIIAPAKWTMSDVPRFIDASMKMAKYGTGQDVPTTAQVEELTGLVKRSQDRLKEEAYAEDLAEKSDEQLLKDLLEELKPHGVD